MKNFLKDNYNAFKIMSMVSICSILSSLQAVKTTQEGTGFTIHSSTTIAPTIQIAPTKERPENTKNIHEPAHTTQQSAQIPSSKPAKAATAKTKGQGNILQNLKGGKKPAKQLPRIPQNKATKPAKQAKTSVDAQLDNQALEPEIGIIDEINTQTIDF